MKLTNIKDKISYSIYYSICYECINKTIVSTVSSNIIKKIHNEIRIPNTESIEGMQRRIFNKLKNEIN